jgi:hypothetical protein
VSRTIYRVLHEDPPLPSSLRPGIAPGWDRVLGRLLAKIPDARYATAGEFLHALDGLAERNVASSRKTTRVGLLLAALALVLVFAAPVHKPESLSAPAPPAPPATSLPLQFVARHEHRIGHCTGDLSLAENGLVFVALRHGEWRFPPERIESLAFLSETELELRARAREESETFRFTFLRPALERNRFREYQARVLARGRE